MKAFQGFKLPVYIILVQDSSGRDREARTKIASVSLCVCEYVIECVWLRLKTLKKTFPPASSSSVCHFQADQKTEDILSKAGFTGFYVFFLRPDHPQGIIPFQNRSAPPSVIVSGLSQAGEVRQPRDYETSYRQKEDSGSVKAEGRGSITPFLHSPPSPSLWAFL